MYVLRVVCVVWCWLPGMLWAADALYAASGKAMPVTVDSSAELPAEEGRTLELKIFYPAPTGVYPLVVLSHGTFSNFDRYDLIARYWAARGYVVILPQHSDADYGVQPASYADMQGVTLTRVADMSRVLDGLADIERQIPGLAGRIDHDHYVAAGHSLGTQVAMLVTGMQYKGPYEGELISADEDRYAALILVSDPGKMRMMPEDLWLTSSVPTFMATGTDDYGLMGARGPASGPQSETVPNPADVDRYLLLLQNGDHYFGGLVQKEVDTQPDHEGLAIFNALSTAFLDAQTKGSEAAQGYLDKTDVSAATRQRAALTKY